MIKKYRFYIALVAFYLVIALFYTFPLITQFTTHTFGVNEDSATHVWYLWWFRWAVVEGHSNPFWTDWIFYPQIINRTFDVHTWTNAILSLPFQYLFGVVTSSNIVFIFSLIASAIGAYLLSLKLTSHKGASIIAGLIFAFCPFIFAQAEDFHTNLITTWIYPFYVLSLLYLIEKPSLKKAVFSGLLLGAQILNDWTYTSFLLAAGPIVYFYFLLTDRKKILNVRTIYYLFIKLFVALTIGSPMIIAALITVKGGMEPAVPTWVQDYYASDIAWFVTPSPQNPFLSQFSIFRHTSSIESTLYVSITALIIIVLASLFKFRKIIKTKEVILPSLLFGVYFLLSLGPALHFFDKTRDLNPVFQPELYMPFTYFQLIPLIGGIKEPTRFAPFLMLGFAILVSFSLSFLTSVLNKKIQTIALTIVAALILFEFYPGTAKTTDLTIPKVYETIKNDPDEVAVLDLPAGFSSGNHIFGVSPIGSLQFYQTDHHKKIFRGTVARIDNANIDYYRSVPLLHYLASPAEPLTKEDTNKEGVQRWFKDNQVKYIVIHKDLYKEKKLNALDASKLVEDVLGAQKFSEDEKTIGYKVF